VKQPTRGALMPTVLSEVGSITLIDEHDLLASPAGQDAVADGLLTGLAKFFGQRGPAVRIELDGAAVGTAPEAVPGDGPPYWAAEAPDGPLRLRVTNTGSTTLAAGSRIVAGWEPSDAPYLYLPPATLDAIGDPLPALEPGESVVVSVVLPEPSGAGRALAWISLVDGASTLADRGSPALQLASEAP
jgi:hypothetical protein